MKFLKKAILVLTSAAMLMTGAGCKKDKNKSSRPANIDSNVIETELLKSAEANDTVYTLNAVIDAGAQTEEGDHYIYLDITIKNKSKKAYSLSTLNNFKLIMPDGSEVYSHIRTQLYATNNMKDKYFVSPFDIESKGEFSGVIGGFVLPENQQSFAVCFYPTKEDLSDYAKETVIKVNIEPTMIKNL